MDVEQTQFISARVTYSTYRCVTPTERGQRDEAAMWNMFEIFFYIKKGTAQCHPEAEAELKKAIESEETITI